MLKRIAVIAAVLFAVLLLVVGTRPGHLHVERSMSMAASPTVVFPLIDDFHAWQSWSPWEKLDPNMKREITGAPRGKGALYNWFGNDDVGSGTMEIVDSDPLQKVQIRLEFKQPWAATNTTTFTLVPVSSPASGTRVTWSMDGENSFSAKAMGLVMDMDQMIGKDFESGLTNLQAVAEAAAEAQRSAAAKPPEAPNAPAAVGGPAASAP
jgi:hypothetical protein